MSLSKGLPIFTLLISLFLSPTVAALSTSQAAAASLNNNSLSLDRYRQTLSEQNAKYSALMDSDEFHALMMPGDVKKANLLRATLVPDSEKSVYDYVILGNRLFRFDDALSI